MTKTIITILTVAFAVVFCGLALVDPYAKDVGEYLIPKCKKLMPVCPKTAMVKSCTDFHTIRNWKLKESSFKEGMELPTGFDLIKRGDKIVGYSIIAGAVNSFEANKVKSIY